PSRPRIEFFTEIWIVLKRREEGVSRAASFSQPVHELVETHPALLGTIEVGIERFTQSLDALDEPPRDFVDVAWIRYEKRAVVAMQLIAEAIIAFHLLEVRKDVVPAPAWIVVVPS